jgi:hypothetical protein
MLALTWMVTAKNLIDNSLFTFEVTAPTEDLAQKTAMLLAPAGTGIITVKIKYDDTGMPAGLSVEDIQTYQEAWKNQVNTNAEIKKAIAAFSPSKILASKNSLQITKISPLSSAAVKIKGA